MFFTKIKDIITLGSANILAAAINGIFWYSLALIMGKPEFGEISFLLSIAYVGLAFSNIGISSTITIYEAKKENVFFPLFVLGIFLSIIAAIIGSLITNNFLVGLVIIGSLIFSIMQSMHNSKQQYWTFSWNILLRRTLSIIFAIALYPILGIEGILLGYFIGTIPGFKAFYMLIKSDRTSFRILKSKIRFMLNTFISGLMVILFWWGDKLVIGPVFGYIALSNFQIASQYLFFLNTIPAAFLVFFMPKDSIGQKNKKMKIFSILISGIISIFSIISIPFLINYLLPEYNESIFLIQIMSIGIIPLAISSILESNFLGMGNSKWVVLGSIIQTGTYLSLLVVLGHEIGLIGISISFLLAICSRAIFSTIVWKITINNRL
jgi:O-antigen/teichoic acid export membrane protein